VNPKKMIAALPVFLLLLIYLQGARHFVAERDLVGVGGVSGVPFKVRAWFDGGFQAGCDARLNAGFGFRKTLVRVYRELDFRLFGQMKTGDMLLANDGKTLLSEPYTTEFFGVNPLETTKLDSIIRGLDTLNRLLAARGKQLLISVAPDKTSFYPELIPNNKKRPFAKNVQTYLMEGFDTKKITYIDFKTYFQSIKRSTKYQPFTPTGLHWNAWGAYIALDSITKNITQNHKNQLPDLVLKDVKIFDKCVGQECDLDDLSNRLYPISGYQSPRPVLTVDSLAKAKQLTLLTISDSFYTTIYDLNILNQLFKKHYYLYYNRELSWNNEMQLKPIADYDLGAMLKESDVVILSATNMNIKNLGWGFIQNANRVLQK
jgi:hypothetical protein